MHLTFRMEGDNILISLYSSKTKAEIHDQKHVQILI